MCGMVCRFWFVCHFSVAGLSHEICCALGEVSECGSIWMRTLQNTREPISQTIASVLIRRRSHATLVSTPTFSGFPWILRGVNCRRQQSHVAVKTSSRVFGVSTIASVSNLDSDREEFSGRAVITSTTTASASARGSLGVR